VERYRNDLNYFARLANRIRHTIHEHLEEGPVSCRKLSEMLRETYEV
jgi:hypothetical protein